jgi:MoaA/NifB/PqqE/SkfB family radical SAM enzyme
MGCLYRPHHFFREVVVMYAYNDLRSVHLELTNKCNAMCPQCARTINGGKLNPALNLTELSIKDIRNIFDVRFLKQLKSIALCGNYGDPIVARDVVEICEYFRESNPHIELELHTNGGARSREVWKDLAGLLDRCIFAIDGLEDTNHIYRQHVLWKNVMTNASAFISEGGNAEWHFLIFKHNEHQVEEAEKLAEDIGFSAFRSKRTGRFVKNGKMLDYFPILNSEGEEIGKLEPPVELVHLNVVAMAADSTSDYVDTMNTADIHCLVEKSKSIYISAQGFVYPCCWLAQIVPVNRMSEKKQQIIDLIQAHGGFDSIDAKEFPIEFIVESDLFQFAIPNGWDKGSNRLKICAKQCSEFCLTEAQNDWHPVWLK